MATETAAPPSPAADKKDSSTKTPNPADLPLKGNLASGEVKSLDGKTVLKGPSDPRVYRAAKSHVRNIDAMEDAKHAAQESSLKLVKAIKASKKKYANYVRVPGKHATYIISIKDLGEKLTIEKQDKVK